MHLRHGSALEYCNIAEMALRDLKVLAVDDHADVLIALRLLLKSLVAEVVTETNPNNVTSILSKKKFDIVILDMNFNSILNSGGEGIHWLKKIKEIDPKVEVVLITAYADIDLAIKSLKDGASNFLVKPWRNDKLINTLNEIVQAKHKTPPIQDSLNENYLLGKSTSIKNVIAKIQKVAPTTASVLILGQDGTGKKRIAKAIHDNSTRKEMPFIQVDLSMMEPGSATTTLYGDQLQSISPQEQQGAIEKANGGTLFLYKIEKLSPLQQSHLLMALQNGKFTPTGSNQSKSFDIRLISATDLPPNTLSDESTFNRDFFYQINTVELVIPSLVERQEDLLPLTKHFIRLYADKYMRQALVMDDTFLAKLQSYSFPGNVRELQHVIEKAVLMADTEKLMAEDLVFSPLEKLSINPDPHDLKLETIEKNTILKVLEKNKGNVTQSAKELGITRTALYRRLNKYGIS